MYVPTPSAAGNRSNHEEGFLTGGHGVGQGSIRRLERQILLASEEAQERTALERNVIANRPAQHGVSSLEGIENGSLRRRPIDLELDLRPYVGQRAQVLRKLDSDSHGHQKLTFASRVLVACRDLCIDVPDEFRPLQRVFFPLDTRPPDLPSYWTM